MTSSADYGTTVDVRGADGADGDDDDKYAHSHRRCCVRYGNTWILCALTPRYGYFPTTMHIGPHYLCMLVTYCIAIGPLFLFFMKDDLAVGLQIALVASVVLTTCAFTMVAFSDPGVVFESIDAPMGLQLGDAELGRGVICAQCQIRRPHDASHCSDCGVCISQLDHHCPWTGKCIGKRTLRLFYLFLWCISVHVILIGVTVATTYFTTK